ncbi:MAG: 4-hydroxyphenylpyruvate dioxygenase [Vicinamibacterales bacterium]
MHQGSAPANRLGITGVDHMLLYAGNAHQTAHFYSAAFGFRILGYSGLETGHRNQASWVLGHGDATLVVTSGLDADGPAARHVNRHGDSVKDVAFRVESVERAFAEAVRGGARPVLEPATIEDQYGRFVVATVGTVGDLVHSFVDRRAYHGPFVPGYVPKVSRARTRRLAITAFDHFAVALTAGTLDAWVDFYRCALGFHECHEQRIDTGKTGMRSRVMAGGPAGVVFPLLEPVDGASRSQVQEFLDFNCGPGVQHAAIHTTDIIAAVRSLIHMGMEFVHTPDAYYEAVPSRMGRLDEDLAALQELRIMVDKDDSGYLFQIFTKSVTGRPTFFIELIQRKGSRGFGAGNVRALFEAIEREQAVRERAAEYGDAPLAQASAGGGA